MFRLSSVLMWFFRWKCQMGRRLSHHDRLGGLDCTNPCPQRAGTVLVLQRTEFRLCTGHMNAVQATIALAEEVERTLSEHA